MNILPSSVFFLILASGTNAGKNHRMLFDPKVGGLLRLLVQSLIVGQKYVPQFPADPAPGVEMRLQIPVEMIRRPLRCDSADLSLFFQNAQIPIHRSQAQRGMLGLEQPVDPLCRRMNRMLRYRFVNRLPYFRLPTHCQSPHPFAKSACCGTEKSALLTLSTSVLTLYEIGRAHV